MIARAALALAALAALAAAPARAADKVTLKNGRAVVGSIVARGDEALTLRTSFGDVELRLDQITSIDKVPDPAPARELPAAGNKPAPKADAAAAPKPAPTPQEVEALRTAAMAAFASPDLKAHVAVGERIVAEWPGSAPALDALLASPEVNVRIEAVPLLGRDELGDQRDRVRRCIDDSNAMVRMLAVRIARHHADWKGLESELLQLAQSDPSWPVRQEALRGLEDVGTVACARALVADLANDRDADHRRRYRRVLARIAGKDLGDDMDAWRAAVEAAISAAQQKSR